jgi:hypothetical protein
MTTYINVVRYHLVPRVNYLILPWLILAFVFGVDAVVLSLVPAGNSPHHYVGGLASIFILAIIFGALSMARTLPFGLALGLSRRSFYLGTALLAAALAATVGVVATLGQAIERATDGWGLSMGFFRVPYILDGPWYLTWLTSFVALALLFVYGMWTGLVYRLWGLVGLLAFLAVQVSVLVVAAAALTWTHAWPDVGHFFTALSAAGLTGLLAALTVALFAGGLATIRRVAV